MTVPSGRADNHGFLAALLVAAASFAAACPWPVLAQEAKAGKQLASLANNPLADKVSLPFQYDANRYAGSGGKTQQELTILPLIPFRANDDWDVITRTIVPIIVQPGLAAGEGTARGLGDMLLTAFLSPARVGQLDWGVGPVLQIPSAKSDSLGQGKWAAGLSAATIWSSNQWSIIALINNVRSFAGDVHRPPVNQMQLQPMISYNFPHDRYVSFAPTITAIG